jgi:hypothetical protein
MFIFYKKKVPVIGYKKEIYGCKICGYVVLSINKKCNYIVCEYCYETICKNKSIETLQILYPKIIKI